jgi:triosephosphate isomerase
MMRKPVIAGNWKMHTRPAEAVELARQVRAACETEAVEVLVCPPYTSLAAAREALRGSAIGLGAQNVHWEAQGAFTGEVSAPMLVEAGCRYAIIGHSERRQHFGETDETVHRRIAAAVAHGLTPIVCIGETLAEREAGKTFDVLERQLAGGLGAAAGWDLASFILAYEPVWAIGTGRNATPEQAQEAHRFIRQRLQRRLGAAADALRLQYGGSVTAANAAGLLQQPDVDGALVGGASLKADAFAAIVRAAAEAKATVKN